MYGEIIPISLVNPVAETRSNISGKKFTRLTVTKSSLRADPATLLHLFQKIHDL